jgi:hypothetical protein
MANYLAYLALLSILNMKKKCDQAKNAKGYFRHLGQQLPRTFSFRTILQVIFSDTDMLVTKSDKL